MAQCKYCQRKGFFLAVTNLGLCSSCDDPVRLSINRHLEIIDESATLVDSSKVFKTRIGRLQTILDNLDALQDNYISRGIDISLNVPKEKERLGTHLIEIVEDEAVTKTEDFLRKAGLAKTLNTKINNANKALLFLRELQDDYGYTNEPLGIEVMKFIHDSEYQDLLLKAEKEEFKENTKKAIDKYKDVLFFLKKDDIDDNLQRDKIEMIEGKIEDLTAAL